MSVASLQCMRSSTLQSSRNVSSSSTKAIAGTVQLLYLKNGFIRTRSWRQTNPSGLAHCKNRAKHVEGRSLQLRMAGGVSLPEPVPEENTTHTKEDSRESLFSKWRMSATELRAKAAKWGLAAVLAYGLFDGITYTTFFVLAFLGYEKSTGQNPAANLKALVGVVVLMWGGNNVTRPFRVAGAAALAPVIDKGLKKMQAALKLPNQVFAFMICVAVIASLCISVIGILILSRLGR